MEIQILNWAERHPRKDYRNLPWVRIDTKLPQSRKLSKGSVETKWTYVALICLAGQENKQGKIPFDPEWIADFVKISVDSLKEQLLVLQAFSLVALDDEALKLCQENHTNGSRTDPYRFRSLRNERNVTERNERNDCEHGLPRTDHEQTCTDHEQKALDKPAGEKPVKRKRSPADKTNTAKVFDAYSAAYAKRYGEAPPRNAKSMGICSHFLGRIPADEAPLVAEFYVSHSDSWYVRQLHPLTLMLKDAEKLRTEWKRGHQMNAGTARQVELQAHNRSVISQFMSKSEED